MVDNIFVIHIYQFDSQLIYIKEL